MGHHPRFFYAMQNYQSHIRVGSTYRNILRERFTVVHKPDEADVVFIHQEPHDYSLLYRQYPCLKDKYVISYCVWEASELPIAYRASLQLVQEVWTCSEYCRSVIAKHHPNVQCVPHAIDRDVSCNQADIDAVKQEIAYGDDRFYFMAIGRTLGSRKNFSDLAAAFNKCAEKMPNARLILKGVPGDPFPPVDSPNITYLPLYFSDQQINALYGLCQCYVSSHHAEAWGLTLSDAMLFGKPVIATGYSGNCDYMTNENSFLIRYQERPIAPRDQFGLFTGEMLWAYPDEEDLLRRLQFVYDNHQDSPVRDKVLRASSDVSRFSLQRIKEIINCRMERVTSSL